MSTLQFSNSSSNGSNVLGTLASSRTFPLIHRDTPPRARVCRSLFGPVDHEELNREMKSKLREIAERDQRRWNFNFGTGVPLLGEYEWEETPGEASPAFYQECVRAGKKRTQRSSNTTALLPELEENSATSDSVMEQRAVLPDSKTQERSSDSNSSGSSGKLTCRSVRRKRPSPLTTTRITDFYVKRRNSVGVKQSFPSAAEEQTPRKRLR